jgi:hypothetical protein
LEQTVKRRTPEHYKTADLATRLGIERWGAVGILESLWHYTADFAPRGNLGRIPDAAIAAGIGWQRSPEELIAALVASHWLDVDTEHRLIVHNWPDHCEDSIHMRLAREGVAFADGTEPKTSRLSKSVRTEIARVRTEKEKTTCCAHTVRTESALPLPLPKPMPEPMPEPEPPVKPAGETPVPRLEPPRPPAHVPGFAGPGDGGAIRRLAEEVSGGPPDDFDRYWQVFVDSGKALNEADKLKAAGLWVSLDASGQCAALSHAEHCARDGTWPTAQLTPMPANHLRGKPWTRQAAPRRHPTREPTRRNEAEEYLARVASGEEGG